MIVNHYLIFKNEQSALIIQDYILTSTAQANGRVVKYRNRVRHLRRGNEFS